MALHPTTSGLRSAAYEDLVRALLIVAAVIVVMIAATLLLGVSQAGPSYDIVPDPAGLLPF